LAGHLAHVLIEVADGHAAIDGDLAFLGLLLTGDEAEEGRLAGAVRTDEAHLLPTVEGGRGLDEEDLLSVLLADVVEADHGRGICQPRPLSPAQIPRKERAGTAW